MKKIDIIYTFVFDDESEELFNIQLNAQTLEICNSPSENLPTWTELTFYQCPHCPLTAEETPHCPVARALYDVTNRFSNVISYDKVFLKVTTSRCTISQHTTVQKALSSLLGLLIASSGCPHTTFFKPMARLHLPLATEENTLFRATGMYLIAQYIREMKGEETDLQLRGLRKIYDNIHILNIEIAKRLRKGTRMDSSLNAVVLLDLFTIALPFLIETKMEKIAHWFDPYFSDLYADIMNSLDEI